MSFFSTTIQNYKTRDHFGFELAQNINESEDFLKRIVEICNEKLVYEFLFKEMCNGETYNSEDAKGFLKWIKKETKDENQFSFFILDKKRLPVGTIGIKSANRDQAEIGYWLSESARGLMTNALIELCKQARDNHFQSLFALCDVNNLKSQGVVQRAGFKELEEIIQKGSRYKKYQVEL